MARHTRYLSETLHLEDKSLKLENDAIFLKIAGNISEFSKAKRLKVGAVIVSKRGRIIGTGFNGTPSGTPNCCETDDNITHDHVIHAELNAILNATTSDLRESTMYLTHSPCIKCASALLQVGISKVVYSTEYRKTEGLDLLFNNGIDIIYIA